MRLTNRLAAAVIAGGNSRRFGSLKIFADFEGKTLLDHAVALAQKISPEVLLIGELDECSQPAGIPAFPDLIPGCGPLGGIYTALYHSKLPLVASLPCDMPLLTVGIYSFLGRFAEDERPSVAVSHKGLEPLVSIWPKSALPVIQRTLWQKRFSIREALRELNAAEVYLPAPPHNYRPEMFSNINYKEDLRALESHAEVANAK